MNRQRTSVDPHSKQIVQNHSAAQQRPRSSRQHLRRRTYPDCTYLVRCDRQCTETDSSLRGDSHPQLRVPGYAAAHLVVRLGVVEVRIRRLHAQSLLVIGGIPGRGAVSPPVGGRPEVKPCSLATGAANGFCGFHESCLLKVLGLLLLLLRPRRAPLRP